MKWLKTGSLVGLLLGLFVLPALAEGEISVEQAADTIWVLQAGFAMVEAGFARAKNAGNIVMKNLMAFAIVTPVYWAVRFTFMFGRGDFIGAGPFFVGGPFEHLG